MPDTPDIGADVIVSKVRYGEAGYNFTIHVRNSDGRLLAYHKGWRPTYEWAAMTSRSKSKRMVRTERRRAKKEESHIKKFEVKP